MSLIVIEPGAAKVLGRLHDAGYGAYVVGGCVRDALLGNAPNDWDICTSALPEQTMALFGEENCIPTGLKHGTVTVKMDGGLYEVTTFRTEGSYSDGRHPDSVAFVADVREDLSRRDFTINAMAYSDHEGLVDPFGGREDLLENRTVRAVGEPRRRFSEDALRIMRLLRFASRFGFAIEEETYAAALALREKLSCVSGERIREELLKLLETKKPGAYLPYEIIREILPEFSSVGRDVYEQTLLAVDSLIPEEEIRLAALLLPLSDAGAAMKRLRCSNRAQERVLGAVAGVLEAYPEEESALRICAKKMLGQSGRESLRDLLALSCAVCNETDAGKIARLVSFANAAQEAGDCVRVKDLAVNGVDVMAALGRSAGPKIGRMLERLLDAVISETMPNERDVLMAAVKEWNGEGKS